MALPSRRRALGWGVVSDGPLKGGGEGVGAYFQTTLKRTRLPSPMVLPM